MTDDATGRPAPEDLDAWVADLIDRLGLPAEGADVPRILDLAHDAAHGVARPAAPLTTFLAGIAVGRGMPLAEAVAVVERALLDRRADADDA